MYHAMGGLGLEKPSSLHIALSGAEDDAYDNPANLTAALSDEDEDVQLNQEANYKANARIHRSRYIYNSTML
jgi:hypothetical protein